MCFLVQMESRMFQVVPSLLALALVTTEESRSVLFELSFHVFTYFDEIPLNILHVEQSPFSQPMLKEEVILSLYNPYSPLLETLQ